MIPHPSRLLDLWRIAAHYRLDTLLAPELVPERARSAMRLISLHPAAWHSKAADDPMRLKRALEDMGPLFVKLGQLLSTRRDLIPPELIAQLVYLQDQVSPFDVTVARQRVEQSLGASIDTLFARFDARPLAAASIASTYSGKTTVKLISFCRQSFSGSKNSFTCDRYPATIEARGISSECRSRS